MRSTTTSVDSRISPLNCCFFFKPRKKKLPERYNIALDTFLLDCTKKSTMAGKGEGLERKSIRDENRVASTQQNNDDSRRRVLLHGENFHAPNKNEPRYIVESDKIKVWNSVAAIIFGRCWRNIYLYENAMSTLNGHVNTTVAALIALGESN